MTVESMHAIHLTTLKLSGPMQKIHAGARIGQEAGLRVLSSFPTALHHSTQASALAHDWLEDNMAMVLTGGIVGSLLVVGATLGFSMRMASF